MTTQQFLQFALALTTAPVTSFFLANPTPLTYTLFNTPQDDITCTLPGSTTAQPCGSPFTAGPYTFRTHAPCGQKNRPAFLPAYQRYSNPIPL